MFVCIYLLRRGQLRYDDFVRLKAQKARVFAGQSRPPQKSQGYKTERAHNKKTAEGKTSAIFCFKGIFCRRVHALTIWTYSQGRTSMSVRKRQAMFYFRTDISLDGNVLGGHACPPLKLRHKNFRQTETAADRAADECCVITAKPRSQRRSK